MFDLKQKAETRQIRNLVLKGITDVSLEQSRSKIVMLAKDHLNPKKSSGFVFSFIPQLFIALFDKEESKINKNEVVTLIKALTEHIPVKELLKIGAGSYASLVIQIGLQLCQAEVLPLLVKFATYDNVTFA